MDRDRFESELDRLIAAHDRKVCAEVDAGACRTRWDYDRMHRAQDAYQEARDAFVDEVFAPPPPAPLALVVAVVGREERVRGDTRGRPFVWRRWIEVRVGWRGVAYALTANAEALTLDTGAVESGDDSELRSPDFDPLNLRHSIRFRGLDYVTTDPAPAEVAKPALEACRAVALRLHARGVDHFAVTRAWSAQLPAFEEVVKDEPVTTSAA